MSLAGRPVAIEKHRKEQQRESKRRIYIAGLLFSPYIGFRSAFRNSQHNRRRGTMAVPKTK